MVQMKDKEMDTPAHDHLLLQKMLKNIPDSIILLIDKDYRVILGEGPHMRRFKMDPVRVRTKKLDEFFSKKVSQVLKSLINVAYGDTTISHEMLIKRRYYYIQAIPIAIEEKEGVHAVMVIFEDVTDDRVNAEALKSAKLRAEKSSRSKSRFLADISHEIRTPLNSVIGFAEQLAKTKMDDHQEKLLGAIRKSSDHLLSILNETITLSKVEAEEFSMEKEVFSMKDVLSSVESMERIKAEKKGLRLNIILSEKTRTPMIGDPVCLKQILLNVINNAIKFTDKGSVSVAVENLEDNEENVFVKFRISDTGTGIPKNRQKKIFDEFVQGNGQSSSKKKGSGLGLSITRKLVELQQGTIEVESNPGEGSTFTIIIPFERATEEEVTVMRQNEINPLVLEGRKILLVDDDEMNRMLAKTIFTHWNVHFDLAADGYQALSMAGNNQYDVILLDIRMPGMDGLEVAQHIRYLYRNLDFEYTILAVTANVLEKDLKRFLESGIDGYLLKPFKEIELFDAIVRNLLSESNIAPQQHVDEDVKAEEVTREIISYDLSELKEMSGKPGFVDSMLNTFISNSNQSLVLMSNHLDKRQWREIGELAHKMVPSYRHLKIDSLVSILEDIERFTLHDKQYGDVPSKVEMLYNGTLQVIEKLEQELNQNQSQS
jgi:signal transduction histidine kinase/CheY-like chemotaxis protein